MSRWSPFRFNRSDENDRRDRGTNRSEGLTRRQGGGYGVPSLAQLHQEMNQLFDRFVGDTGFGGRGLIGSEGSDRWFGDFSPGKFTPDVDIVDEKKHLRVSAELPGLGPDDIDVTVQNGMLLLKGEKKVESEREEEGCYRTERAYGYFQRSIPLPTDVNVDAAEARFDKGVLTIRLPKKEGAESGARKIKIGR